MKLKYKGETFITVRDLKKGDDFVNEKLKSLKHGNRKSKRIF